MAFREARFFIDRPVDVRLEGGLVHAELKSGEETIHIVGTVNNFLATFRNMAEVAHEWRGGAAEVVAIEFDAKFERVFPSDKTA